MNSMHWSLSQWRLGVIVSLCWLVMAPALAAECPATVMNQEQVLQRMTAFLQERSGKDYERIEVQAFGALPVSNDLSLELKSPWPASRVAVQVRWLDCESGRQQAQVVWLKAAAYRQAWVYGADAKADTPLVQARPMQTLVDVAPWRLAIDDLASPEGSEFLRTQVRKGAPVRKADIKPAPLVRKMETVQLVLQGNGVRIAARATALQSGAAGELISVIVSGSEKSTHARVAGAGVVHVEM